MNRSEFISFIEDPEKLSKDHLGAIRNIMTDFPYFSVAHVLYTKALHNERHYEFEKQLKQTALRVPDREVLYRFIHQVPAVAAVEDKKVQVAEEPVAIWTPEPELPPAVVAEPEPEIIPEEKTEEPAFIALPVEETIEAEIVIGEIPEEIPEAIITEEVEIPTPEPVADIPVEEPVTDIAAIHELIAEESSPEFIADIPTPGPEIIPEPVAEITAQEEVIFDAYIPAAEPEVIVEEAAEDEPATENNETHSFMEWLQLKAPEPHAVVSPSFTEPGTEQIEEITTEEPGEVIIHPDPAAVAEVADQPVVNKIGEPVAESTDNGEDKSNVQQFENILDKFIREKPSISRPKAEFYNPVNMARQSVEEDEELVTETLASLYHKQGNHRKAIRAYEKLCLLYPGKMSYFAALIQKIKAELKD